MLGPAFSVAVGDGPNSVVCLAASLTLTQEHSSDNQNVCWCVDSAQSCLTLSNPMDPPGSSVHGIFQARILESVAISYSRGSSWPRDGTCISCVSCFGRQVLHHCVSWASCWGQGGAKLPMMRAIRLDKALSGFS